MTYTFSKRSIDNLNGVHPKLIEVVVRALFLSEQDFGVLDGARTFDEQKENVKRGVSKTMKSKHLRQPDSGYSHAVDLVPFVNGQFRWEWPPTLKVAEAMRKAATELSVPVRWGGSWSRINGTTGTMAELSRDYTERHPGPDFLDGVHFELSTNEA